MLKVGDTAPAWTGQDQHGKTRSFQEFSRGWLLLYFYPKDDTPGCTIEACAFRDDESQFAGRLPVVGVSADTVESHQKFSEKYQLTFTLIADTEKKLIAAYGTNGLIFPKRVTFLIDSTNVIRKIYHGFDCTTHSADVQKDLDAFGV
jgi:peroxiredoxin Q/BCP